MDRTDNGTLVAFEGIDGGGKTTQVGHFVDLLRRSGITVIRSKEPTDGHWGRVIRESATTGRLSLDEELSALIKDRKEHLANLVLPALERGETVVLDRYFYSTIAYQGVQSGADPERIASLMYEFAPIPNIVVLIDVPPEIGLARIVLGRKERPNVFETSENLQRVRQVFLALASQGLPFIKIDGTESIETVRRSIIDNLLNGGLKTRYCGKSYGCDDPSYCALRITDSCDWITLARNANGVIEHPQERQ